MKDVLRQTSLAILYGVVLVALYFLSAGSAGVFVYQGF